MTPLIIGFGIIGALWALVMRYFEKEWRMETALVFAAGIVAIPLGVVI